ncbi:hypothetical protein ABIB25_004471 [Nakamurella sp. UYEF19]|uniref:hypothetical protein n=1 Tax=Nakamurella sp. UYEF19 TaxID=1756392 RepID=UPI0033976473
MSHTLGQVSQAMLGRPSTHINHTTYHSTYHSTGSVAGGGSYWWIIVVAVAVLVIALVARKMMSVS